MGFLPGAGPLPSLAPPARPESRASRCWPRPWPRRVASLVPRGPATPPTCRTPSANRSPYLAQRRPGTPPPHTRRPAESGFRADPPHPCPASLPLPAEPGSVPPRHGPDPLHARRPAAPPDPAPRGQGRQEAAISLPFFGGADPQPALGAARLRVGKTEGRRCVCSCFSARLRSDVLA